MNTGTGRALARGGVARWRSPVQADLPQCLALHPASQGAEIIGERRALQWWSTLLRQPAFNAALVEVPDAPPSERIAGFGAVVFVTRDFADCELANPAPGLNSRVFASFEGATPVILDERGLRTNNAGVGLDLVVLISTCRPGLSSADVSEVRARLTSSFLEIHLGYRFNQLLFEATDRAEVEYTVSTQAYRLADDFGEFHRLHPSSRWNRDRGLFVINRSDALAATGSIASLLFEMREPRLHLRPSDQTLAGAALEGRTDPELALALGISVGAVKKRWLALYYRIGRLEPSLLADAPPDGHRATRGPQKRHRVLAHLRQHPEELKPW